MVDLPRPPEPLIDNTAEVPEIPQSVEVGETVSLNRLSVCQKFEEAAQIFLENPAAFTTNSSASVQSSTHLSVSGFQAYLDYLSFSEDPLAAERKQQLLARFKPLSSRVGLKRDGTTFKRPPTETLKAVQTCDFLYPELLIFLFDKGHVKGTIDFPEEWDLVKIKDVVKILFSFELPKDLASIFKHLSDFRIDLSRLENFNKWLKSLNGTILKPLLEDHIGSSDVPANMVNSLSLKIDLLVMLK